MTKCVLPLAAALALTGVATGSEVLVDQTPAGFSSFVASTAFGTWEADDFISADSDFLVTHVAWWGGRNDPHTPLVDGFIIRFYDSVFDAALGYERPDQLAAEYSILGDAGQHVDAFSHAQYFAYEADLPSAFLALGATRYWVSIMADLSNDPNDPWWGWRTSDSSNFDTALVHGSSYDYVRISDPPFNMPYQDMALALTGIPVPAPFSLLPLAGVSVLRRRWRG